MIREPDGGKQTRRGSRKRQSTEEEPRVAGRNQVHKAQVLGQAWLRQ